MLAASITPAKYYAYILFLTVYCVFTLFLLPAVWTTRVQLNVHAHTHAHTHTYIRL